MKKRITIDQLQELSPCQQNRLREWWKPQEGDLFTSMDSNIRHKYVIDVDQEGYIYDGRDWFPKADCLPLLSVGQCIELLENSGRFKGLLKSDTDGEYKVYIILNDDHGENDYIKSGRQLIDALWEAVKVVL